MFRLSYRYLLILLLAAGSFALTMFCEVYRFFNIQVSWYHAFLTMLLITFCVWEGARIIEKRFAGQFFQASKARFLLAFFLASCTITTVAAIAVVYAIGHIFYGYSWPALHYPIKLNLIYGFLITLGLHLSNATLVYFEEYRRQWHEAEKLREITAQAQIQLMRSQIKPHFLFNNLNVLSSMVIRNNPEANEFIEAFAAVYRYILKNHDKAIIEVSKELDFIEPYIFLLRKRFDRGLEIEVDVPDHFRLKYIIPAALQMLIENAIKHNTMSSSQPLRLSICANNNECLVVKNNRQSRAIKETSTKIGLQNIQQRYELISSRKVEVNQTDEFFTVTIPLLHVNSVV